MFISIILKGAVATTLTQPLDVLKTRAMNAKPGEFKVIIVVFNVIILYMFENYQTSKKKKLAKNP